MTCHSAKGQEWDYVFVLNVVNGVFPRYQNTSEKQEEEKRVFYVAVTRHHKKLYLLQATSTDLRIVKGFSNHKTLDKPSPFIDVEKQGLVCINATSKKPGK